jgi:hypothetical protein
MEYEKELIIKHKINVLLNLLESGYYVGNLIKFAMKSFPLNTIKINGINNKEIINWYNKFYIFGYNRLIEDMKPQECHISIYDGKYSLHCELYLNFGEDEDHIEFYPISKLIIIELLHSLIEFNVKLYDDNDEIIDEI